MVASEFSVAGIMRVVAADGEKRSTVEAARPRKRSKPSNGRTKGGIQSVDAALRLLKVMSEFSGPATLTEISQRAQMPSSKAHRYLASFVAADFVDQAERSGRYELSKAAIEVGLSAISRLDFVERAANALPALVDSTGASAVVAIWGSHGPTAVRWQRSASFIITSMGLGSTFPLLTSATGRVFLAFSPRRLVSDILTHEIQEARRLRLTWPDLDPSKPSDIDRLVERIRGDGYASVDGRFVPGLNGVSAPILNWQGEIEAAITLATADSGILDATSGAIGRLMGACRDAAPKAIAPRGLR
jgi:DNA-binding IclR family transcriptional regulator